MGWSSPDSFGPLLSCSHLCCSDAGRTRGHVHTKLLRQTVHPSPNWPWSCLACKIGCDWVPSRWYSQSPALWLLTFFPSCADKVHDAWVEILKATHFPSPHLNRVSLCSSEPSFVFSWLYFSNILCFFFLIWRVFGSSPDDIFSLSCHSLYEPKSFMD